MNFAQATLEMFAIALPLACQARRSKNQIENDICQLKVDSLVEVAVAEGWKLIVADITA